MAKKISNSKDTNVKENKEDVNFYNTAQAQAMYEMYISGEYLSDLSTVFKMDESQLYKIIKGYKNNYAGDSERDADIGDIIRFKYKNCDIIGEVVKRYVNIVVVKFKNNNIKGSDEDISDLYLLGNMCVVNDRYYRIVKPSKK